MGDLRSKINKELQKERGFKIDNISITKAELDTLDLFLDIYNETGTLSGYKFYGNEKLILEKYKLI